jgi:hypothetical protein
VHDGESLIAWLLAAIDTRDHFETTELAAALLSRTWPGGHGDRSEPVALEWVRRWGPSRLTEASYACSCEQGRCTVCN